MKTTKPFGYPVTKAGLPRNWCTIKAHGDENVPNLTAQEIAKTFWLLESIHIKYAYSVNSVRKERKLLLQALVEPIKRIELDPLFYYTTTDPDDVKCSIELELSTIAHNPKNESLFNLNLTVEEQDKERLFTLTCKNIYDERLLHSFNFEFINRQLTARLYTLSTQWSGKIEYFSATPEYYEIKN